MDRPPSLGLPTHHSSTSLGHHLVLLPALLPIFPNGKEALTPSAVCDSEQAGDKYLLSVYLGPQLHTLVRSETPWAYR